MSDEPISVRVARKRGCEPAERWHGWFCDDGKHLPGSRDFLGATFRLSGGSADTEAWLTPAASFALLAEMVEAGAEPSQSRSALGAYAVDFYDEFGASIVLLGDTLPEAIALAWLAWKEAQ